MIFAIRESTLFHLYLQMVTINPLLMMAIDFTGQVVVVIVVVSSFIDPHPNERMRNLTITLSFKHCVIYKLNTKRRSLYVRL